MRLPLIHFRARRAHAPAAALGLLAVSIGLLLFAARGE